VAVEIYKEKYRSQIREVVLGATPAEGGTRSHTIKVGGAATLPFLLFEGDILNAPVIALEVWDMNPQEWPESLKDFYGEILGNPVLWAKKCVEEYGADLIALRFKSADPDLEDASIDKCVHTLQEILKAVKVPLIIYGCGKAEKDNDLLTSLAESAAGENLLLGVAELENYRSLAAAAMAYGHSLIAQSPIDINMAKQLNILISELSPPLLERIVIDPTIAALGYGLEYSYSIMERARLGALSGDKMLAMPMIGNVGLEVWGKKETTATSDEKPGWGEAAERALAWETVTAMALLHAGLDILVMRHPLAAGLIKKGIDDLLNK